jgi:predicted O-methyltransferase YrrM
MPRIIKRLRTFQRFVERSWNLYRLRRDGRRVPRSVAHSVRATLASVLTPDEKDWIDRIEHLRAQMDASTTPITCMDYGAGDPDADRTPEEMAAGVEIADTLGHISHVASKPPLWCCLLFRLIRDLRPVSCIEMGTAVGISAAYQAAALRLNGTGALVTLEGAAPIANIARDNFRRLGLTTVEVVVGRFQNTLPEVLIGRRPVDYIFVDGHHDEQATLAYFEQILPYLADTAILVFDDITWSEGMKRAWTVLAHDRRVSLAIDFGPVGMCVIDGSSAGDRFFRISLHSAEQMYEQLWRRSPAMIDLCSRTI